MMAELPKPVDNNHPWLKWVGAVTVLDANQTKEYRFKNPEYDRYLFYDNDSTDLKFHEHVLQVYKKYNVDVIYQRIGQGFHYFGSKVDYKIYRSWWEELRQFNPKWPPHDIRVTKKYDSEIFERPVYVKNVNEPENWARGLMFFLNKEMKGQNSSFHKQAMMSCGLHKYFVLVNYTICRKCYRSCEIGELDKHIVENHFG